MPTIDEIKNKASYKPFKKREYRPWNIDGAISDIEAKVSQAKLIQELEKEVQEAEVLFAKYQNNRKQAQEKTIDTIIEVDCGMIKNWEFHDRPENELGDIEALAAEFKEIGQQQPCIVRKLPEDNQYKYELIVGERRWHAAKAAGVRLKVIVRNLNDNEAAIIQASENYNRKDLSDYARGMSYNNLIENNIVTQKDLAEKLGISKQQISRLLSFAKIPAEITSQIQDMSKISSRTAEQIKQLSSKGENYIEAIITLADRLRSGKIGQEKLQLLVEEKIKGSIKRNIESNKIFNSEGKHLYTLKQENNEVYAINFAPSVVKIFKENKVSFGQFNQLLQDFFEEL